MRVAILTSGGHLDRQLQRSLQQHDIKGDVVRSITRRVIDEYGCIVLSDHNEIPNLPVLVERLVLERSIHVIYISKTPSIGQFYSVLNDLFFHRIQEFSLEVELPLLIRTIEKFDTPYSNLQQQHDDLQDRHETLMLTNKAKRHLIKQGYSEEEAHQFIQKTAMDKRMSKKQLVSLIIQNKIDI